MTTCEGSAHVNLPEGVFYNPVQEFNRDITICAIRHYLQKHFNEFVEKGLKKAIEHGEPQPAVYRGLAVLEALAASGLRSVRYAKEVPLICRLVANDLDPAAAKLISENAKINAVDDILTPSCANAVTLMMDCSKDKFNVVDIDPYGTACPFLDSAMQCIFDGGLLCVTCTDMAVLCGSAAGTAYGKYGGVAIKMAAQHEQGLRLLLHAIQQAASRHDKIIEPLLSLSVDFYARVFVRVRTSASGVKRVASRMALVYSCTGCQSFYLQRLGAVSERDAAERTFTPARGPPMQGRECPQCGSPFAVAGPLWADEIHNHDFVRGVLQSLKDLRDKRDSVCAQGDVVDYVAELKPPEWLTLAPGLRTRLPVVVPGTLNRLIGMLTLVSEELPDCPFYFQTDKLCSTLRAPVPKIADLRSAFLNAGYRVSFSHAALSSIKTDAPMSYIWDVMCAWKRRYEAEASAANRPSRSPSPTPPEGATKAKATHKKKKHPPSEAALRVVDALMSRPPNPGVDFTLHPDSNPPSRADGLLRYQMNPLPNWGPKGRAKTVKNHTEDGNSDDLPQPKSKKSKSTELH